MNGNENGGPGTRKQTGNGAGIGPGNMVRGNALKSRLISPGSRFLDSGILIHVLYMIVLYMPYICHVMYMSYTISTCHIYARERNHRVIYPVYMVISYINNRTNTRRTEDAPARKNGSQRKARRRDSFRSNNDNNTDILILRNDAKRTGGRGKERRIAPGLV